MRILRLRWIVPLLAACLLLAATHWNLRRSLARAEDQLALVDASGQQRALSGRVARLTFALHASGPAGSAAARSALGMALEELEASQELLPGLEELAPGISREVAEHFALARAAAEAAPRSQAGAELLEALHASSERLAGIHDFAMRALIARGSEQLSRVLAVQMFLVALALALVFALTWLVYVPLMRRSLRAQRELLVAQRELERHAAALERINADLEEFAYVASHDLQEPLRVVAGFAELLQRKHGEQLDAEGREFLVHLANAGRRMGDMVRDLLEYSRVGRLGTRVPVELDDALDEALADVGAAIEEQGASIERSPLPRVQGDRARLVQLFQHLLDNALKFRGADPPRIHIGAVREVEGEGEGGELWRISIRDNGIGIDPQYAQRIFVTFRRLHGRERYPGTGIGLSIAKRIVERHGGTIGVDSEPDVGATFWFTLPAAEA